MSAARRLRAWLAEPGPGTAEGRRLAATRTRLAAAQALQAAARAAVQDAADAAERDLLRHETCMRVQASGRCVPGGAVVPLERVAGPGGVPNGVPDYLVELVEREGRTA